jgi:hypothetical protein
MITSENLKIIDEVVHQLLEEDPELIRQERVGEVTGGSWVSRTFRFFCIRIP